MAYELPNGLLVAADEQAYHYISNMIRVKNDYIGPYKAEYSQTLHSLDLLQYTVLEARSSINSREQMNMAVEKFAIAKQILNQEIIDKIQYCIDTLEAYVQANELMLSIKEKCR